MADGYTYIRTHFIRKIILQGFIMVIIILKSDIVILQIHCIREMTSGL